MKKGLLISIGLITSTMYSDYSRDIHQYMLANYYYFSGKFNKADRLFSINDSIYSNKGRIHYWYKKGEYKKIADIIPKIENLFNNDPELQLVIINALQKIGRTQDAYQRLIKANNRFPSHPEITFVTVGELIRRKELKNALQVIDKLLNNAPKKPNFFVFYFLKGQIYTQLQDSKQALENIEKSLEIYPHFTKGWLLFALLQEQVGNLKHAIKGYTSYLELTGSTNKQIAGHLMQLVIKDKLMQQNKRGIIINTSCFNQAAIFFKQKQYKRAIAQIDQCIMENPNNTKAKLFKIQILTADKKFNHAAAQLRAWIHKEPSNGIWYKTLHLLVRIGAQPNTIIKTFESIERDNPKNKFTSVYLADLYIRSNNNKAIEYLNKSAEQITDPILKTKILFQLGVLYFEQEKYNEMCTVLKHAKSLNINFPPLMNLLAHYYATKGHDLPYAKKLIADALLQDKNNPHFLDTQALIFYKQKRYTKAQQLLAKLAQDTQDATILLHLAKAEYRLKNTNKARHILNKAHITAQSQYEKHSIEKLEKKLMTK